MEATNLLEALFPDRSSAEPLVRQLTRKMRGAIESGALRGSARLLPSREMALRLGLARNTVVAAIAQLVAEGYLEARVGSGTFVVSKAYAHATGIGVPRALRNEALQPGIPDLSAFPINTWNRVSRRHLARLPEYLSYGDPNGYRPLRQAISDHLQQFRGVASNARNIIIVEGAQAALALASAVLLGAGDRVLLEDPCYVVTRRLFAARGVHVVPLPVEADGLDADLAPPAHVASVAPSHQYPLGGVMSIERRAALLRWAVRNDAYVLEDDYDSEFAFAAHPLPSLQSLDRSERVVYVGTFSKTLAPGLRVGYLVVPEHLRDAFRSARRLESFGSATIQQAILAEFVAEGHFALHVRRMTRLYAQRRKRLLQRLAGALPAGFELGPASTGLHVALRAPSGFDDVAVAAAAARSGLQLEPLSPMCIARTDCAGFMLGYAFGDIDELDRAIDQAIELITAWRS